MDTKFFIVISLSFFISFSNCREEILNYFNVTKIEPSEDACFKEAGRYYFNIMCDFDKPFKETYIVYAFLETPTNGEATCIPKENFGFNCFVNLVDYPLTEKKLLLSKQQPYSYFKYIFNNWEEYITEHRTFSETIDCSPSIRNTFIYSSVEKDVNYFILKGEWSNKTESYSPQFAAYFILKMQNSTKKEATCTYKVDIKTEYNCTYKGEDIPSFEDQIVRSSDNYVYKIAKKNDDEDGKGGDDGDGDDDGDKNGISNIVFNMLLILIILLYL